MREREEGRAFEEARDSNVSRLYETQRKTLSMGTRDPVHMHTAFMGGHEHINIKQHHIHTQTHRERELERAFGSLYNSLCGCQLNLSALSTAHTHAHTHSFSFNS